MVAGSRARASTTAPAERPMFAEALRALAVFTEEATGMHARIGGRQVVGEADTGADVVAPDGAPLGAGAADDVVTLSLVSVHRTDRFRNTDREVLPGAGGSVTVRQPPGW